jgi:hypothetical protein
MALLNMIFLRRPKAAPAAGPARAAARAAPAAPRVGARDVPSMVVCDLRDEDVSPIDANTCREPYDQAYDAPAPRGRGRGARGAGAGRRARPLGLADGTSPG